ncbi:MAG: tetratricopeptide repeat protein [Tannerella sp.]|uniref:tetratricopeptide repeat protein n=1 Tax=Tannerella sp. TaxID=2382127 RepID=UPI003FA1FE23
MMKVISKILCFGFMHLMCGISLMAQESAFKEAEVAYKQENYAKAIELYEELLKNNGESYQIYYNLGNAYYKTNKIAPAILNYERALLLNPGDGDIRFNLEMSRLRTTDKIEPIGEFFLVKWFRSIRNLLSVDVWASMGIACFILFIGCLILFFFSKWMRLKKIGFYAGIFLLLTVVLANIFAWSQKKALITRDTAIIFASTITIKSSPDTSGTDLFVLHEGTKVQIKSTLGEWYEIRLEDGKEGWIPQKELKRI